MTCARALVLCDWLLRMDQSSALDLLLDDQGSERNVLWTLEVWLEHLLVFELHCEVRARGPDRPGSRPGYAALVRVAREEVMIDRLGTN
jgi:hypothetical protein